VIPAGGSPLLAAEKISCRFPGCAENALENITLELTVNEFVILAGRNGSGKTLLTRILTGIVRPSSGRVLFEGKNALKDSSLFSRLRQKVGLVFQDADSHIIGQSVEDELRFGPENLRLPEDEIRRRTGSLASLLGLKDLLGVPPARLSGGEKRRLAIGGVLAMRPDLLILDEPFANLDYPGVVEVLRLLQEVRESGCGILLITHELEKALAHADRLIIMDRGRIAEDGSAREKAGLAGKYGLHPLDFTSHSFSEYTWLPS
jgi:biotin transport system ATP-binding protein